MYNSLSMIYFHNPAFVSKIGYLMTGFLTQLRCWYFFHSEFNVTIIPNKERKLFISIVPMLLVWMIRLSLSRYISLVNDRIPLAYNVMLSDKKCNRLSSLLQFWHFFYFSLSWQYFFPSPCRVCLTLVWHGHTDHTNINLMLSIQLSVVTVFIKEWSMLD